jgi:hypothetical protein
VRYAYFAITNIGLMNRFTRYFNLISSKIVFPRQYDYFARTRSKLQNIEQYSNQKEAKIDSLKTV